MQPGAGENHVTVWLIDWKRPKDNHFAIAAEVTVKGSDVANAAKASTKRPDVVIYVNGIALGLATVKSSVRTVSLTVPALAASPGNLVPRDTPTQ